MEKMDFTGFFPRPISASRLRCRRKRTNLHNQLILSWISFHNAKSNSTRKRNICCHTTNCHLIDFYRRVESPQWKMNNDVFSTNFTALRRRHVLRKWRKTETENCQFYLLVIDRFWKIWKKFLLGNQSELRRVKSQQQLAKMIAIRDFAGKQWQSRARLLESLTSHLAICSANKTRQGFFCFWEEQRENLLDKNGSGKESNKTMAIKRGAALSWAQVKHSVVVVDNYHVTVRQHSATSRRRVLTVWNYRILHPCPASKIREFDSWWLPVTKRPTPKPSRQPSPSFGLWKGLPRK